MNGPFVPDREDSTMGSGQDYFFFPSDLLMSAGFLSAKFFEVFS